MGEGSEVTAYLTQFHNNWNRLEERCEGKSDEPTQIMSTLAKNTKLKAMFLLFSLPKSMVNIVDNLQTKGDLSYDDICERLTNLHSTDQIEEQILDTDKAFVTNYDKGKQNGNGKECTWCKSKKDNYMGHTYDQCKKLKAVQAQRKAKKGKKGG